ncbi:hypothetical protein HC026_04900 [Lactobacillus sp. LC28-10]|uniref:Tetratricopeptide repeat protein n=1 Tax=Secundilactobacillus angelensis TaxID=2722706 RepID=A0ABX1KZM9_9LACO|nr:hypothetical protein [Secundilactobacillus angelensis]MCH5462546.1 hypothetical protein [Secundilactobacillus angelensis]NLR18263.1 hypothetical protein [Secundilactobacillus angelensis]
MIKSLLRRNIDNSNQLNQSDDFDKMYDAFTPLQKELDMLWSERKIKDAITLGESMITRGDKFPVVFSRMAVLYHSQKRYEDEIRILKLGIQAQIYISNPGDAKRNFEIRLKRTQEILARSK